MTLRPCIGILCAITALPAVSATRVMLLPGDGYVVELQREGKRTVLARPRIDRKGWQRLDRYVQVAADGGRLAVWERGVRVYSAEGRLLFQRADALQAFRFSPNGARLAVARDGGVEIVTTAGEREQFIGSLPGVEEIRWTNAGLVVRSRGWLLLLAAPPDRRRTIAAIRPGDPFAAAGDRVVYAGKRGVDSVTLSSGAVSTIPMAGKAVELELSNDGSRLLAATATEVLLDGMEVARATELRSLAFSADGTGYLWLGREGGAAGTLPLPAGTLAADFGAGCVAATTMEEVTCRKPESGDAILRGGISSNDGTNYAAVAVGENGMAVLYYLKPGHVKRQQIFTADPLR